MRMGRGDVGHVFASDFMGMLDIPRWPRMDKASTAELRLRELRGCDPEGAHAPPDIGQRASTQDLRTYWVCRMIDTEGDPRRILYAS